MRWFIKNSAAVLFFFRFVVWPVFLAPAVTMAFQDQPFERWGFHLSVGITLAIISTYYLLKLGDYFEDLGEGAEEGERIAKVLEGLLVAGQSEIDAQKLVAIWYESQPVNEALRLAIKAGMYARLREAVRRGWLRCPNFPAHEVRTNFLISMEDSVAFFRRRLWLRITPQ